MLQKWRKRHRSISELKRRVFVCTYNIVEQICIIENGSSEWFKCIEFQDQLNSKFIGNEKQRNLLLMTWLVCLYIDIVHWYTTHSRDDKYNCWMNIKTHTVYLHTLKIVRISSSLILHCKEAQNWSSKYYSADIFLSRVSQ